MDKSHSFLKFASILVVLSLLAALLPLPVAAAEEPDLSNSSKVVDKDQAYPGEELLYTIVIANTGPGAATSVSLSDPIPTGATYVAGSVTGGAYYSGLSDSIIWNGSVGPGESVTVTFKVTVDTGWTDGGTLTNVATIADGWGNSYDCKASTIIRSPLGASSKAYGAGQDSVYPGDYITYTISLVNSSTSVDYADVAMVDMLPANTHYVTATATSGTVTKPDGFIRWEGTVPAGDSVDVTLVVTAASAPDGTEIVNQAGINDGVTVAWLTTNKVTSTIYSPIAVTKTVDKSEAQPGDELSYTILVQNLSQVNTTVWVTDTLDPNTTFVPGSLVGGTWDGSRILWDSTLAPGGSHTVSFRATVNTTGLSGVSSVVNTAQVYDGMNPVFERSASTELKSLLETSTKEGAPENPTPGQELTYTILLNNTGDVDATGASLSDMLSDELTYASSSPGTSWDPGTRTVTWSGDVPQGEAKAITITAVVNTPLDDGTLITNTVAISDGTGLAAVESQYVATVSSAPDLSTSTKAVDEETPEPGDVVMYMVTLNNTGTSNAYGVLVTDTVPMSMTYLSGGADSGSFGQMGGVITWTGDVDYGVPVVITFTAGISEDVPLDENNQKVIPNTVCINDGVNPVFSKEVDVTVTGVADLYHAGTTKTVDRTVADAGEVLTYTIVVSNTGTGKAFNAELYDVIPADTSIVSGSWSLDGPGSVLFYAADNSVRWFGGLAVGEQAVVTYAVQVDEAVFDGDVITNTATVYDGVSGSYVVSAPDVTIEGVPDLSESEKRVSTPSPRPGDRITYTIFLKNTGDENIADARVRDFIDTIRTGGRISGSVNVDPDIGLLISTTGFIQWRGPLSSTQVGGTPVTITFAVTVNSDVAEFTNLVNTAVITDLSVPPSLDAVYNLPVTATVKAGPLGDSTKTGPDMAYVGDELEYVITLSNIGADTVVTMTDEIPANTVFVTATADAPALDLPAIGATTGTITWTGTISQDQSTVVTVTLRVAEAVDSSSIVNSAVIQGAGVAETITRSATTQVLGSITMAKAVDKTAASPGDELTYTVVVTNDASIAVPVMVTDVVPAHTTYVSGTVTGGAEYSETLNSILWTGEVAGGASHTISYGVQVNRPLTDGVLITNTATVNDLAYPGVLETNEVSTAISSSPDLSTSSKAVDDANPEPGQTVTYTLVLVNTGTENAAGVQVTDLVEPAATVSVITSSIEVVPETGTLISDATGFTLSDALVAYGSPVTITYQVEVTDTAFNGDPITNTAVITQAELATPITLTEVSTAYGRPDFDTSTKAASTDAPTLGEIVTYTIRVTNTGSVDAEGATVTDQLPTDTTYVSHTPPEATFSEGTLSWTGDIAAGDSITLTLTAQVNEGLLDGTSITNTVEISHSRLAAPVSKAKVVQVTGVPDHSASTKSVAQWVYPGEQVVYTLSLVNRGTGVAREATLYDPMPDHVTYAGGVTVTARYGPLPWVTVNPAVYNPLDDSLSWTGVITNDAFRRIRIQFPVTVAMTGVPTGTQIMNSASLEIPGLYTPTVTMVATATVRSPLYQSSKTTAQTSPGPGDLITYTISVVNSGPATYSARVTDTVPTHTSFYTVAATSGTFPVSDTVQGMVWTGDVAPGATELITYVVMVDSSVAYDTEINNTATINDGTGSVLSVSAPVATVQVPVEASKTADPAGALYPGQMVTYTIMVHNIGESERRVWVTDTLDANTVFHSQTGGVWDGSHVIANPDLTPGEAYTITVKATVKASGLTASVITNTVEVNDGQNPVFQRTASNPLQNLLSGTKAASHILPLQGDIITYTVTLVNNGPAGATDVSLTDVLPDGLSYGGYVSSTTGVASAADSTISWTGTVPAGGTEIVTYTAQVARPWPRLEPITNTATVDENTGLAPIELTRTVYPLGSSDLSASAKTVSPAVAEPGEVVTYTITLTNTGYVNESGVILTDTIPADMTYVEGSVTGGATYSETANMITWEGDVDYGSPVVISFQAMVSDDLALVGGSIVNTAWVSGSVTAPFERDATLTVGGVPVLAESSKEVTGPMPVVSGEYLTYTILLKNTGTGDATEVVLLDPIPAGTVFDSFVEKPAWVSFLGGKVQGADGTIAVRATETVTFKVLVTALSGTRIENVATVQADGIDTFDLTAVVCGAPSSMALEADPTALTVGETSTLTATVLDPGGYPVPDAMVTFSIISGSGTVTPTVSMTDGEGKATASLTSEVAGSITVQAMADSVTDTATVVFSAGELAQVVVTPSEVTLAPNGAQQFAAAGYDAYGNEVDITPTWSVADPAAGTIDATGLFTAGTAVGVYPDAVVATADGITGTADVTVAWPYQLFMPVIVRSY